MPRQKSIPFDATAMLNEPVEADPLPITDRFIDTPLRPYANPKYLARHLREAVEFEARPRDISLFAPRAAAAPK